MLLQIYLLFFIIFNSFLSFLYAVPINSVNETNTSYIPIVVLHGILSSEQNMEPFSNWLEESFDTKLFNIEIGNGKKTSLFTSMNNQLNELCETIYTIPELKNGFHFIGMSQGGLLARGYVEKCNKYPVLNLITMVSPHGGVILDINLGINMYNIFIQNTLSFSNYWRDPTNLDDYLTKCSYLPLLNNEKKHENFNKQKENIKSLTNFIMIWSPFDEILNPPESAEFSFYDKYYTIIPLDKTLLYNHDILGLKSLNDKNKLHIYKTNCTHTQHRDPICFPQLYNIFKQYL